MTPDDLEAALSILGDLLQHMISEFKRKTENQAQCQELKNAEERRGKGTIWGLLSEALTSVLSQLGKCGDYCVR